MPQPKHGVVTCSTCKLCDGRKPAADISLEAHGQRAWRYALLFLTGDKRVWVSVLLKLEPAGRWVVCWLTPDKPHPYYIDVFDIEDGGVPAWQVYRAPMLINSPPTRMILLDAIAGLPGGSR